MAALNYPQLARILAFVTLVGGLGTESSFASSNISRCEARKVACLRSCPRIPPKGPIPGRCTEHCQEYYDICRESGGIPGGSEKRR